jgi:hypothetical protein
MGYITELRQDLNQNKNEVLDSKQQKQKWQNSQQNKMKYLKE